MEYEIVINATFHLEEGRIKRIYASACYPSKQEGNLLYDSEIIPNLKFANEMPKALECLHAVVAFRPSHVFLSRDVLGGKPLYYDKTGISSFGSYLENPIEVLPGEIIKLDYEGRILEKKIFKFEEVIGKEEKNLEEIEEEIIKEMEKLETGNYCVAFSGGIDSALLASIYDLPLISITASEKEEEWIKRVSKELSRDLMFYRINEVDVKQAIPEVLKVIESSNFLQLSIAIPIHLVMKFAKRNNFDGIIFGQGADELFGGYKRYEKLSGPSLEKAMLEDLKNIGKQNLVRDTKLSYYNELKLILPYLRWNVIKNSLSVPVDLKIARIDGKVVRKYFLRTMARKYLSEEIVWKEKKAIQYSTGISKILKKHGYSRTGKDLGF